MTTDRTPEGIETTLSVTGFGRFLGAAFIGVWLTFWAVGEAFALWLLAKGAWALLTGEPPEPGRSPLSAEEALPIGLFLLIWGSFWTLGGIFAGREFLRLLFGRDTSAPGRPLLTSNTAMVSSGHINIFRARTCGASTNALAKERSALKRSAAQRS